MIGYILTFVASFLLSVLSMFIRGGYVSICGIKGLSLSMLANLILYFLLSFLAVKLCNQKCKLLNIMILIFLGGSILVLPFYIMDWNSTWRTFSDMLLRWIAMAFAFFFYKNHTKKTGIAIISVYVLFCLWMFFQGTDIWMKL